MWSVDLMVFFCIVEILKGCQHFNYIWQLDKRSSYVWNAYTAGGRLSAQQWPEIGKSLTVTFAVLCGAARAAGGVVSCAVPKTDTPHSLLRDSGTARALPLPLAATYACHAREKSWPFPLTWKLGFLLMQWTLPEKMLSNFIFPTFCLLRKKPKS